MNKQKLQQEIEALQKQLEEKQKELAAMPDKWEPKGGDFWINENCNVVHMFASGSYSAESGLSYQTRQQAEKAAKAMRAHNRLVAYVAEFAPDYESGMFDQKWFVTLCYERKIWCADWCSDFTFGMVFMPEHVAINLAAKLNSGEVEL